MTPYYEHAGITIYHGDCREVLPSLEPMDLVLTDPPYGVRFKYTEAYEDTFEGYTEFAMDVFRAARAKAPVMLITTGMKNLWLYPPADWVLCWAKPGSTRRSALGGFNEWEPVLVYGKPRIYNDFKYLPDCVNHSDQSGEHPCPKPLELYKWLLNSCPGESVLDPFIGSGTTLRAAKDLGRRAIGIEIEEKYCEIAAKRLSQEVFEFER